MNISSLVNNYISQRPSIKDCLKKDLINFSALARSISKETKLKKLDAIMIACRRYRLRLKKYEQSEELIRELLQKAKLRVKTKIAVVTAEKPRDLSPLYQLQKKIRLNRGDFLLVEADEVITIITNMEYVETIETQLRSNLLKSRRNLAQLTMIFDRRLETTSGVMFFIFGLLAERGINVFDEVSCWTDVVLVIEERALASALDVLQFKN